MLNVGYNVTYFASVGKHFTDKIQLILTQQPVHMFVHILVEVWNLEQLNTTAKTMHKYNST